MVKQEQIKTKQELSEIGKFIKIILLCLVLLVSIFLCSINKSIEGWIIFFCSCILIYLELKDQGVFG